MAQSQAVAGFFDNVAEAYQAVQLLLNGGFSRETLDLSTRIALPVHTGSGDEKTTNEKNGTGHFLSSLFGESDDALAGPVRAGTNGEAARRIGGTLVTVQTQSADEAKRATNLLNDAGAVDVNARTVVPPGA